MATQDPKPRVFQQVLSDVEEAFLSRTGVAGLRVGGGALSAFESFAQSEARQNQDVFAAQNANDPSRLTGDQLDRYGLSRGVKRLPANPATTDVTIGDSRFVRIASPLSPLHSPPIPGQTTLYIQDGGDFTPTGSVYVGRGTDSGEGPIAYTSVTNNGSDWSLALAAPIARRHSGSDEVLLAQGGERLIESGTIVRTQQGNSLTAASYTVVVSAAIPDGDIEVRNVQVVCTDTGTVGNAPAGSISAFSSLPFPGATVTNPSPVTNGRNVQLDPAYLQDIYRYEATRSRGTASAAERFSIGVRAPEEPSAVLSSSYVHRVGGEPDTLTIDDGTGYQPIWREVSYEQLIGSARGGERDFQVSGKPVTKAFVKTTLQPPWAVVAGTKLAFDVAGKITEHALDVTSYPAGAEPYVVSSDINSNPTLAWEAVVTDHGEALLFRAKSEFGDDIRSIAPESAPDAAPAFGLPRQTEETLFLYVDDVALVKDGRPASYASRPVAAWGVLAGSQTIEIAVDGTPPNTYTITDQDFVDARTGFSAVGRNTPAAWAAVLQRLIAGITARGRQGRIFVESNLGISSRARIQVLGGTLVGAGMFDVGEVLGLTSDFVFDRAVGQGRLATPLAAGQSLSAGSDQGRAFLGATPPNSVTFASTATWWIALDADGVGIETPLTPANTYAATAGSGAVKKWGTRLRITTTTGAFSAVTAGDFVVFWDVLTPTTLLGQWLVARVDSSGAWIELDRREGDWARFWCGSCVLTDGRVLVAGGYSDVNRQAPSKSAEIYDPATGIWSHAGYMSVPRAECWAVALPGGKALVGGGFVGNSPDLWTAGVFTATPSTNAPTTARGQTATLASDGKVYVVGGQDSGGTVLDGLHAYNPGTGTWATLTACPVARFRHAAAAYGTGFWVTCGITTASALLDDSYFYETGAGTWTSGGAVGVAVQGHAMTKVGIDLLVTGGNTAATEAAARQSTSWILSSGTPPWISGPSMTTARCYHGQVTLSGGKVLVAGGEAASAQAELYDPAGPSFSQVGAPLLAPRAGGSLAALASNAAILSFGALPAVTDFGTPTASAEKWSVLAGAWSSADPVANTSFSLTSGGVTFGQAADRLRRYQLAAATDLTATALAQRLQTALSSGDAGSSAATYRTKSLRWRTNSQASRTDSALLDIPAGDIYLAATNPQAAAVLLPEKELRETREGQAAWVCSSAEAGTPEFESITVRGYDGNGGASLSWPGVAAPARRPSPSHFVNGLGGAVDSYTATRFGQGRGYSSQAGSITYESSAAPTDLGSMSIVLRKFPEQGYAPYDRVYFASPWSLGPSGQLVVVANQDAGLQRSVINLYRRLKPTSNVYGSTVTMQDADLSPVGSLATSFGLTYDFLDHAILMRARTKTHAADPSKSILWRWWQHGSGGESAQVSYVPPLGPNTQVGVISDDISGTKTNVSITLAGGAPKTGATIRSTSRLGLATTGITTGVSTVSLYCALNITSATRTSNVTTLTLNSGAVGNGFATGNVVYVTSSHPSFSSGPKTLTGATSTTVTYDEVAANEGATPNIGTISFDPVGECSFAGISPSPAAGDWLRIDGASGIGEPFENVTFQVLTGSSVLITMKGVQPLGTVSSAVAWGQILDPNFLSIFTNPAQTASQIAAAVATLYAGGNSPIEPTVLGNGTGVISTSSDLDSGVAGTVFALSDGVNAISAQTPPGSPAGNYSFLLKLPTDPSLATAADWVNEDVRLVPVGAVALARWLREAAVSGLYPSTIAEVASRGRAVQLTAKTLGAAGAVQVEGGSANAWAAVVDGEPEEADDGLSMVVSIATPEAEGIVAGGWVAAQLSISAPRDTIDEDTTLASLTANGTLTVTGGSLQLWDGPAVILNVSLIVERCGRFVKYTDAKLGTALTAVAEGTWVFLSVPATPTMGVPVIAAANAGLFQVVRSENGSFWVEGASQEDQLPCEADVRFIYEGSVLPGDKLYIGTDLWGADNQGTWTVRTIGDTGSGAFANKRVINLDTTSRSPTPVSGPVALGDSYDLVRFSPVTPQRWIKKVRSMVPGNTVGITRVRLEGGHGQNQITEAFGATLICLDKLEFPGFLSRGRDAYKYNVGLVGEVNRVEFGDAVDPVTYPGVLSGGAEVRIDGPTIRRVQFAVAVRLQQGYTPVDVEAAIRSAVAAAVANRPHGVPIPISEIIAEVVRVAGVESVVPLGRYDTTRDSIPVQPGERARVLDLQRDVQITYL